MTLSSHLMFIAFIAYALAGAAALLPRGGRWGSPLLLVLGMLANALAVGVRYRQAWPMLPMHLGLPALPLCLGLLGLPWWFERVPDHNIGRSRVERESILLLIVLLAFLCVFFPRDYYLPFLQSKTLFAHLFLILGVLGKGCFLIAGVKAIDHLRALRSTETGNGSHGREKSTLHWVVWGFVFWTLSMFAGEIWSYLGWGTPVVWDDAVIMTIMATWFYYICFLHLHLTKTWNVGTRAGYAAAGVLVVLVVNCFSDLGPLRTPF